MMMIASLATIKSGAEEQDTDALLTPQSHDYPQHVHTHTHTLVELNDSLPIWSEKANAASFQSASLLSHIGRWLASTLRPEILTPGPRKKIGPTSYLDGLRGFAAFLVYWQHHQVWARVGLSWGPNLVFENGWGYQGRYYFCALPLVRTFFTGGHFAVAIFFVLSGRVLSYKPLTLMQAGQLEKLSETLSSALFRRWLRLYLPCIATTFLYMTSWHALGIWTAWPDHQGSYRAELWNWYAEFKQFSFIFREIGEGQAAWLTYNFHLWSIPVEFKGSVLIYTSLMAFSRCTRNSRLLLECGVIFYSLFIVDGAHFAMFMSGVLITDIDLLGQKDNLPSIFNILKRYKTLFVYTAFAASAFLSGVPSFNSFDIQSLRGAPGWMHLSYLVPQNLKDYKWFFLFWASILFISALPFLPFLRRFFESRFCQYLGRISFSLYLVHGPVLWTLADRLYLAVGWARTEHIEGLKDWIGIWDLGESARSGPLGLEWGFWLPHLLILPVTLWAAEVCMRVFDDGSVRLGQRLYRWTMDTGV